MWKETRITNKNKAVIEKENRIKEFNLKRVEDEKSFKVRQEAIQSKEKSAQVSLLKKNIEQEIFAQN